MEVIDDLAPHLGMEFQTIDEVLAFWNYYGGRKSFEVRKGQEHIREEDDVVTSKVLLCNCEGTRGKDKRDHLTNNPRAEMQTKCQVRLKINLDRKSHKYKVVEFISEHNHPLIKPEARLLIRSQRQMSQVASIDIQLADSSEIRPKAAYELHSTQVGEIRGVGYTEVDHNNCLRNQRKQAMKYGTTTTVMKYFGKSIFWTELENPSFRGVGYTELENSSFKHFEDTNEEQKIANIVWTDGKMIAAYAQFGDVVVFDTTSETNKEKWAFGVFVGFNNFKEIVIFDAALM